jgi:hypothetical protein
MKRSSRINAYVFTFIILLSLTFLKCSKDTSNPVQPANVDYNGLWTGTLTSSLVTTPAAITINMTTTNNTISGTYSVITGAVGTISGTINNNSFSFTLTQTTSTCTGSFTGQGSINGTTITFTYTGHDCWGTHNNGSGTITKYNSTADVICPLFAGNVWTYVDSTFSSTGSFTVKDSSRLMIVGKNSFSYQGQSMEFYYWNWINLKTGKLQPYSWLMRNDNDGLSIYGGYFRNQPTTLIKTLAEKYPVNVGDTWNCPRWTFSSVDSSFKIADTVKYSCISTNQVYATPGGNFNCYVYTYQRKYTSAGVAMIDDNYLYYDKTRGYVGMIAKTNGVMRFKKVFKK